MNAGMPVGGRCSAANRRFPLEFFAPHHRQASLNHGLSLERLADGAGLSWAEALAIVEDRFVRDRRVGGEETAFRKAFAAWEEERVS